MQEIYSADDAGQEKPKQSKEKLIVRQPEEYSEVMRSEKPVEKPLAAFVVKPKKLKFETQDSREKILLLLRKHFIINFRWIWIAVVLAILPVLFGYVPIFLVLPTRYQVVSVVVWYLMVFGFSFEQFLSWFFNVYIITDERIIDYDFYSLLYKRVSEAKIDKIEDVTYAMGGTLMNIFEYGTVYIQTAGEQREIDFEAVPKPNVVVKLLNELMIEEEREKLEGRVR